MARRWLIGLGVALIITGFLLSTWNLFVVPGGPGVVQEHPWRGFGNFVVTAIGLILACSGAMMRHPPDDVLTTDEESDECDPEIEAETIALYLWRVVSSKQEIWNGKAVWGLEFDRVSGHGDECERYQYFAISPTHAYRHEFQQLQSGDVVSFGFTGQCWEPVDSEDDRAKDYMNPEDFLFPEKLDVAFDKLSDGV